LQNKLGCFAKAVVYGKYLFITLATWSNFAKGHSQHQHLT